MVPPLDPRDTSEADWPETPATAFPPAYRKRLAQIREQAAGHLHLTAAWRLAALRTDAACWISADRTHPGRIAYRYLGDAYLALRAAWQSDSPRAALHHEAIALEQLAHAAHFAAREVTG